MCSAATLTLTLTLTFMPTFSEVTEHRAVSGSDSGGGWRCGPTETVQSLTPHRTALLLTNTSHTTLAYYNRPGQDEDKTNMMK